MSELTTKRTLVKSPPELWAEVSDLEALARHLGEFGEIAITRLEPETTVVWEGDRVSGTVRLEPSGWGTKVTLTAELAAIEQAAAEPEPVPVAEPEPEPEPLPEPVAAEPPPPSPAREAPERKPGFWARLLGRRTPVAEATPEPEAVPAPVPMPMPAPAPAPLQPVPAPTPPPAPEPEPEEPLPAAAEPLDDDRAVAVLTGVLDNLGSAHHRPFSRG